MAGDDSPTEKRDEFHFGRSTPPPTTSYVSKQDYIDVKTVAAEPPKEDKEKDENKEKDEIDVLRPDANPGYNQDEIRKKDGEEPLNKRDKRDDKGGGEDDREKTAKKVDGSDILDGQWIPPKCAKDEEEEEEEDDNCTVKCLYYTMQCCECSIS